MPGATVLTVVPELLDAVIVNVEVPTLDEFMVTVLLLHEAVK